MNSTRSQNQLFSVLSLDIQSPLDSLSGMPQMSVRKARRKCLDFPVKIYGDLRLVLVDQFGKHLRVFLERVVFRHLSAVFKSVNQSSHVCRSADVQVDGHEQVPISELHGYGLDS